ncbi:hypothetical protein [Limnobacter sp.]|uniref:hypothetical protein n=1 Tax=Limnobacter sp. TaxID=2003368 RepID=UPI003514BDB1
MSTAPKIGTVASKTEKLFVQRQGEQLTLVQGDAILAGDVIQNKDLVSVDIELPAQTPGQADSLVSLAPNSAAQVATTQASGQTMIEVTSLSDGVELYAVSEGTDGALLLADAGTGFSGLVGAGLLSGGVAGSGVGTLAATVGGGIGVAALASTSGDDTSAEVSVRPNPRVDNEDETSEPVDEEPEDTETPEDPEDPEDPENPDEPDNTNEGPADALAGVVEDVVANTPLEPLGDAFSMVADALPIGSAAAPSGALPFDPSNLSLPA